MQRTESWKEGAVMLVKHFLQTPSQSPVEKRLRWLNHRSIESTVKNNQRHRLCPADFIRLQPSICSLPQQQL